MTVENWITRAALRDMIAAGYTEVSATMDPHDGRTIVRLRAPDGTVTHRSIRPCTAGACRNFATTHMALRSTVAGDRDAWFCDTCADRLSPPWDRIAGAEQLTLGWPA